MELAKLECKPLATSSNQFEDSIKSEKIGNCTIEQIKKMLQYVMVLIGIRAANIPSGIEKDVLIYFIKNNYSQHTVNEIGLAFEMAVAGKLDLGQDGAKCFENFSCEYFGRIMRGYRKWASEEIKQIKKPETPMLEYKNADWSEAWEDLKQCAKDYQIDNKIIVAPIYEWLILNKILSLTVDEKKALYENAKTAYILELKRKITSGGSSRDDKTDLERMNGENWEAHSYLVARITNKAKVLAIKQAAIEAVK